jgi:hypothetical protein
MLWTEGITGGITCAATVVLAIINYRYERSTGKILDQMRVQGEIMAQQSKAMADQSEVMALGALSTANVGKSYNDAIAQQIIRRLSARLDIK